MIHKTSMLADLLTPVSTFLSIAEDEERAFLLESVEGGERLGRYSFIGVAPERSFAGSFQDFRRAFSEVADEIPGIAPLCGGAVGFFSFDLVREFERLPCNGKPIGPWGQPVRMDFYSTILVFDHLKHQLSIVSREGPRRLQEIQERLRNGHRTDRRTHLLFADLRPGPPPQAANCQGFAGERFEQAVRHAQDYIREGDIFQVVLSQRFAVDFPGDPFDVYRALRYLNPSPYHFFLKQGDLAIAGASPEMLVRVQDGQVDYRPIAGTRPRGKDARQDDELAQELIADPKERAEHLMLVDLGRNDVGRVCDYGTVEVEEFMRVERYSHVMHLVSAVKGRLLPDRNALDALQACFPAGTVTGAPKVRAMEIIDELEPWHRGIYSGAVGYLDYSGSMDTCIAIRTIVFHGGKAYVQAGAGIVADSVPSLEDQECRNKAQVLFRALQLAGGAV